MHTGEATRDPDESCGKTGRQSGMPPDAATTGDEGNDPEDEEDEEEHLRDGGRGAGDCAKAEQGCDDGENEEYEGPV